MNLKTFMLLLGAPTADIICHCDGRGESENYTTITLENSTARLRWRIYRPSRPCPVYMANVAADMTTYLHWMPLGFWL